MKITKTKKDNDNACFLYLTNTLTWIFILQCHWNYSPYIDILLYSDTLPWLRANMSLKTNQKQTICLCFYHFSRPWSHGSWIYDYICNQCLSPLKLWVRTPLRKGVLDTTLCDKIWWVYNTQMLGLKTPTHPGWGGEGYSVETCYNSSPQLSMVVII
jgi:hypothetical protein